MVSRMLKETDICKRRHTCNTFILLTAIKNCRNHDADCYSLPQFVYICNAHARVSKPILYFIMFIVFDVFNNEVEFDIWLI